MHQRCLGRTGYRSRVAADHHGRGGGAMRGVSIHHQRVVSGSVGSASSSGTARARSSSRVGGDPGVPGCATRIPAPRLLRSPTRSVPASRPVPRADPRCRTDRLGGEDCGGPGVAHSAPPAGATHRMVDQARRRSQCGIRSRDSSNARARRSNRRRVPVTAKSRLQRGSASDRRRGRTAGPPGVRARWIGDVDLACFAEH